MYAIFSPIAGHLAVRHVELDAFGFQLLAERREVLDFEADVIDARPLVPTTGVLAGWQTTGSRCRRQRSS